MLDQNPHAPAATTPDPGAVEAAAQDTAAAEGQVSATGSDTGSEDANPASSAAPTRIFVDAPEIPTLTGPKHIRYDFNYGCRVLLPARTGKMPQWRVRISDMMTRNIIFETHSDGGQILTTKKYYIPLQLEIWLGEELLLDHKMELSGRKVQVQLPVGTLGDVLAWFPYAARFQETHDCELTCLMGQYGIDMFAPEYPHIRFLTPEAAEGIQHEFYASYRLGLFFDDWNCTHQPVDFRYVGLHKTAGHILGVDPSEIAPRVHAASQERSIQEPYVCIAVQSSSYCKYWNNPGGWVQLVKWLKEAGYRVLCIDRDATWGQGRAWMSIPHGAEDFTGLLPLPERVALLKNADFFVGLSSGLAWLAWAAGTPTVMISGFTHPNNEFYTPYRIFNHHTCNSCWNDPRHMWSHNDFFWCPRHKDTPREFECTRLITLDHLKGVISTIPGFLGKSESVPAGAREIVAKLVQGPVSKKRQLANAN